MIVTREVRVELDPAQIAAQQISVADVSRQLRRAQQQMSGGRAEIGDGQQSLRTMAIVGNVAELGAIDIALPAGKHVRLDEIATVRDTVADRGQVALLNGKPVVAFQIQRSRDSMSAPGPRVSRERRARASESSSSTCKTP